MTAVAYNARYRTGTARWSPARRHIPGTQRTSRAYFRSGGGCAAHSLETSRSYRYLWAQQYMRAPGAVCVCPLQERRVGECPRRAYMHASRSRVGDQRASEMRREPYAVRGVEHRHGGGWRAGRTSAKGHHGSVFDLAQRYEAGYRFPSLGREGRLDGRRSTGQSDGALALRWTGGRTP